MRVNNDCIKAVLNHVIDNTEIKCNESGCSFTYIDLNHIIRNLEEKFNQETIVHSAIYAQKCGYLDMKLTPDLANFIYAKFQISDVTPLGYQFLANN